MINRIQDLTTQATTLAASTLAEVEALRIKYLSKKRHYHGAFQRFPQCA